MNNRFINIISLLASSAIFVSGCGDTSSFETQNLSEVATNAGTVSQKNFSLLAESTQPKIYDATTGIPTDTSLTSLTIHPMSVHSLLLFICYHEQTQRQ